MKEDDFTFKILKLNDGPTTQTNIDYSIKVSGQSCFV